MERSWEIRWFFKGTVPADVSSWFSRDKYLGDLIGDNEFEAREDLYLVCSNGMFISPKLREGKFEIKYREDVKEIHGPNGNLIGKGEYWKKWSWRYLGRGEVQNMGEDPFVSNFLKTTDKDLLVKVGKKRWRRKFGIYGAKLEPVPLNKRDLPYGLLAELTEIKINGDKWWTIAFEVFGVAKQPMNILQQGVNWVIKEYPGPTLQIKNSYSYPEWIQAFFRSADFTF